ncbi:ABC transporter ATP-binding protein [Desulfosediminicola sp.]|uniref:ABC transporter ATP-binding protein n=1 Tax=Desulfosediminicola sp. TaxID=2886825 RepID=UPI003AF29EDE
MDGNKPLLRLQGITKTFGPLVANDSIDLKLDRGEILALLGENGAGKTTLMNILFGHYVADQGTIEIDGLPLPPGSPKESLEAKLGMVHQHFTLADNMTVLDNIMLGTEPLFSFRRKDSEAKAKIKKLSDQYEIDVNPNTLVNRLSVGQRQRVEILKALYRDTRILILDEPTAVLTPQESAHLFATLKLLVAEGLSIIFITHKLREVMAVSDRCLVLRHGKVIHQCKTAETSADKLAREMVGGELPTVERKIASPGEPRLELANININSNDGHQLLRELSLTVYSGEIVGIAGVSGNGQGHLADLVSGLLIPSSGKMLLDGEVVRSPSPLTMLRQGVGRIPEDRTSTGVIGDMTVVENVALEKYWKSEFSSFGLLNGAALANHTDELISTYDVRCGGQDANARTMSGGNMQKLILARALSEKPKVIIANQPTWGLDVGATAFVHRQLIEASRDGAGVIIISEDLDELFTVADVIQVMYQGSLSPPIDPGQTSAAELGLAMSGHRDVLHSKQLREEQS